MPALIAPSPITAMTLRFSPLKSRATAMPSPEEIEVELCAAPNGSYSLSDRLVKPDRPPPWRIVRMRSRRPVRILWGVGLMADIPDQPIVRRVEHVMQPHGQLDHPEPRTKMAAGDRDGVDQLGAQLVGNLPQIGFGQPPQVGGHLDLIEERRPVRDMAWLLIQDFLLTLGGLRRIVPPVSK